MKVSLIVLGMITTLILSACQTPSETIGSSNNVICTGDECELTSEQTALMEASEERIEDGAFLEELYLDYTEDAYNAMLGERPFALFFHASWCPTCQFMEQDIFNSIGEFPEGSMILKADYDTETALKEKYNITSQSLVVMINADGSVAETLVAPGAKTLANSFTGLLK